MLLLYAKNVADMAEIHQALPSQFYLLKPLLGQYFKEYFTADANIVTVCDKAVTATLRCTSKGFITQFCQRISVN